MYNCASRAAKTEIRATFAFEFEYPSQELSAGGNSFALQEI